MVQHEQSYKLYSVKYFSDIFKLALNFTDIIAIGVSD